MGGNQHKPDPNFTALVNRTHSISTDSPRGAPCPPGSVLAMEATTDSALRVRYHQS